MSGRWNSWGATAPLWGPGLIFVVGGLALIYAARKQVSRRG